MSFFTPEEEKKRQEILSERRRKETANKDHFRQAIDPIIQEILQETREAYSRGDRHAHVKFTNERLREIGAKPLPHPEPEAVPANLEKDIIESELRKLTNLKCEVSVGYPGRDNPDDPITYSVSISFQRRLLYMPLATYALDLGNTLVGNGEGLAFFYKIDALPTLSYY